MEGVYLARNPKINREVRSRFCRLRFPQMLTPEPVRGPIRALAEQSFLLISKYHAYLE